MVRAKVTGFVARSKGHPSLPFADHSIRSSEQDPSCVLILDGRGGFRLNAQKEKGMSRFEQRGIYAAKVLNASKMGSQTPTY